MARPYHLEVEALVVDPVGPEVSHVDVVADTGPVHPAVLKFEATAFDPVDLVALLEQQPAR